MELLLGCGASRVKKVIWNAKPEWSDLTTLDMNYDHDPDVVHDLSRLPYPFPDNLFNEIHAYDVMEHTGQQGDWGFFFRQWEEIYRILAPGGVFCGISPAPHSPWAWGDPGHTRIIGAECLHYLAQANYAQVGTESPMTDYRPWYSGDLALRHTEYTPNCQHIYVLQAIKGDVNAA